MQRFARKIFVSYSRTDITKVKPLVRLLKASDVDVFIDVEDIQYGERWESVIEEKVKNAERFLIFWSKNAAKSDYVRREYLTALQTPQLIIIPVSLDGTPLPSELAQFQALTELQPLLAKAKGTFTNYRIAVASLLAILILGGFAQILYSLGRSDTADRNRVLSLTEPTPIASGSDTTLSASSVKQTATPAPTPFVEQAPTPMRSFRVGRYTIPKRSPNPRRYSRPKHAAAPKRGGSKSSPTPSPTPLLGSAPDVEVQKSCRLTPVPQSYPQPTGWLRNVSYHAYFTSFLVALFALLITIFILRVRRRRLVSSINEIIFNKPIVRETAERTKL